MNEGIQSLFGGGFPVCTIPAKAG